MLDQLVPQGHRALPVHPDRKAIQEQPGLPDQQDLPVLVDLPDQVVQILLYQDQRDQPDLQVLPDLAVLKDQQVSTVRQVLQDRQVQQVRQDQVVLVAQPVQAVHRVLMVTVFLVELLTQQLKVLMVIFISILLLIKFLDQKQPEYGLLALI